MLRTIPLLILSLYISSVRGCGDAICGTGGESPGSEIDADGWPPTPRVLGRASWTYLHATASYMPRDTLTAEDKNALSGIVNFFSHFYPSVKGKVTWNDIVHSGSLLSEFNDIKNKEDVILWMWKVHNCVTAHTAGYLPMFPGGLQLKSDDFIVDEDGSTKFKIASLTSFQRKQLLGAISERWVGEGAGDLEATVQKATPKLSENVPPNRAALGRSVWTILHTTSVYSPLIFTPDETHAFQGIVLAIRDLYPCSLCRHHFQEVYPDPIFQTELHSVTSQQTMILFLWKMHNIVTTNQHREYGLFPKVDKEIKFSMFEVPTHSANQIRLGDLYGRYNETMDNVMWKLNQRWKILGGIDASLDDFPKDNQCEFNPSTDTRRMKMDVFLMAMCPWCAKAMKWLHKDNIIKCQLECYEGTPQHFKAMVQWNIHYVGMINDTGGLSALHGPNEKIGDKLELCARDHYSKNYQYIGFIACMDKNVTLMPTLAEECAAENKMDYSLLSECARTQGDELLQRSFSFSSSRAVDGTPTFMMNDKTSFRGIKKNITAIMCQEMEMQKAQMHSDRRWLAQVRVDTKGAPKMENGHVLSPLSKGVYTYPIYFAASGFVLFIIVLIIFKLRGSDDTEEMTSLLGENKRPRRARK